MNDGGLVDMLDENAKTPNLDIVSMQKNPTDSNKYNEKEFLKELEKHVNKTYIEHYSGIIQPVEFIMSNSSTLDYLRGNVVKYIYRYGKKNGNNPADLYKACHFIMMMGKYSKE